MNLQIIKGIASFVTATGISTVMTNVAMKTLPKSAKLLEKGLAAIGGLVIAGVISKEADKMTDEAIDNLVGRIQKSSNSTEAST